MNDTTHAVTWQSLTDEQREVMKSLANTTLIDTWEEPQNHEAAIFAVLDSLKAIGLVDNVELDAFLAWALTWSGFRCIPVEEIEGGAQ